MSVLTLVQFSYFIAATLFLLGLQRMSTPKTARSGIQWAGIGMLIHAVSGNLLTPWLTSRTSRINAVTVFVGVLAFGWLWGAWGLLLGVPILTTLKAIFDRVDELKPIGELMGA